MAVRDGFPQRRIFHGVDFSEQEQQHIRELQEYLRSQNFEHTYDDVKLLRFCAAGDFNLGRTLQKIRRYEEWLRDPAIQTTSARALSILEEGVIYTYGRDFYYRPIIIVQARLIDLTKVATWLHAVHADRLSVRTEHFAEAGAGLHARSGEG